MTPPPLYEPTAGRINTDAPAGNTVGNTVGIEIFIVHIEPQQDAMLRQLWQEIDEQALPPLLRRDLTAQGLRAGLLGSAGSPTLTKFLQHAAETTPGEAQKANYQEREVNAADVLRKTAAVRQFRTLVPDMRALIRIFDTPLPEVFLFWNENETRGMPVLIAGQTYRDALGILCVQAKADKEGGAVFDIVPELEFGQPEYRVKNRQGLIISEISRPRRAFPALTISQRLLPGQWILVGTTATPEDNAVQSGEIGLGSTFFVRSAASPEQRLAAIRFVNAGQTATPGQSATFSPQVIPERN